MDARSCQWPTDRGFGVKVGRQIEALTWDWGRPGTSPLGLKGSESDAGR